MRTQLPSVLLATALACAFFAAPAQAQAPRTFVSAAGSDSNPCSFAAPCRHFQAAVNATSPGGEVDALDPAGYGPITITQPITIEGQGWSYIAPPANGNGITINAVSGNVAIHGVSLNGAGINGGTNGIVFNSGGRLNVSNCVVQNFSRTGINGIGIYIAPASGTVNFAITNTIVSNNPYANILYDPPTGSTASANGVIDHVVVTDSTDGSGISITPGTSSGTTLVAISNSVASNDSSGIFVNGGNISIDNTALSGNTDGISALGTPKVLLGRSVIVGNTDRGIINSTSPNTFFTYQNNQINLNGNGNVVSGSTLVMLPFQ